MAVYDICHNRIVVAVITRPVWHHPLEGFGRRPWPWVREVWVASAAYLPEQLRAEPGAACKWVEPEDKAQGGSRDMPLRTKTEGPGGCRHS